MTNDTTAIAVFCKAPIPGNVKSRLAVDIGPDAAASIYRYTAEHAVWTARHAGLPVVVFVDIEEALPSFHDWLGGVLVVQRGTGLGERMSNAVQQLKDMGYERAIVVGTDVPYLTSELIRDAAIRLLSHDIVLGPSHDGGYYLVGLQVDLTNIFQDIPWSTSTVLQRTMETADRLGYRVTTLPMLNDVDTASDLRSILEEDRSGFDDLLRRYRLVLHETITK
jgi:uncharacterized protein